MYDGVSVHACFVSAQKSERCVTLLLLALMITLIVPDIPIREIFPMLPRAFARQCLDIGSV